MNVLIVCVFFILGVLGDKTAVYNDVISEKKLRNIMTHSKSECIVGRNEQITDS